MEYKKCLIKRHFYLTSTALIFPQCLHLDTYIRLITCSSVSVYSISFLYASIISYSCLQVNHIQIAAIKPIPNVKPNPKAAKTCIGSIIFYSFINSVIYFTRLFFKSKTKMFYSLYIRSNYAKYTSFLLWTNVSW